MPTPANASDAYKKQVATIGSGYINVMHYGATGDGVTDDTAAIDSAMAAANTAGGGTVYFPIGTYMTTGLTYSGTVTIHLLGEASGQSGDTNTGAIIKLSAIGTALTIDSTGTNYRGAHIQNLLFDGASLNSSTAIKINDFSYNILDNVVINMFNGTGCIGVHVDGTSVWSITNTMINCKIRKATTAIKLVYTTSFNIIGGYYADGTTGVDMTDTNNDTLNCVGVNFDSYTTAINVVALGSRITSCRFEQNTTAIVANDTAISIIGNHISGSGTETGITLSAGAVGCQVMGNNYSNLATKWTDAGASNCILDGWVAKYDLTNNLMDTNDLLSPMAVNHPTGHSQFYMDSLATGHQWRLRSRSDQFFDFYDVDAAKYALTLNPAGYPQVPTFAVASLPTSGAAGIIYVTGTSGGSTNTLCFHNGTSWIDLLTGVAVTA